jgi:hypothetical protein
MADTKISALPASTTPLAGTEVLPIVQSSTTKQVSVANLTAGRAISATELTLTTGNLIIGTSGKGIDFSITSHPAGMTSELLADYEEGTWTPVLRFGTTNQTITIPIATYVKVGKSVTVNMQVTWAAKVSSGAVNITGLPFAKEAGGTVPLLAGCPAGSVTTLAALFYNVDGGGTALNLAEQAGDINSASLAAAGSLFCSGTYFT